MTTPSIFSAVQTLRMLLTQKEKMKALGVLGFTLTTSFLEVMTASGMVLFAQVLNQPELGTKYLAHIGFSETLSSGRAIFYMAIGVGGLFLVKNGIAAAEVFYQNFSIQKLIIQFKNKLLHLYGESNYGFYLTRNSYFYAEILGRDVEHILCHGMIAIAGILSEVMTFLFLVMMMIWMNPSLALVIFCVVGLGSVGIIKVLLPWVYGLGQRLQESSGQSGQNLIQFFHGFKEIVLLGKRKFFIDRYHTHLSRHSHLQALQNTLTVLPRMVIEILFMGIFVAIIGFLCLEHETPGHIMGILGGYLYTGFRLMPGLNRLITHLNHFKSSIPSIERVSKEWTLPLKGANYKNIPDFQFNHTITIKDLCFRHLNTSKDVLNHVSCEIKKGQWIGIVGETGSGKSTFIDLILGLLTPCQGEILIDQTYPVNAYQWHEKIGYVPQNIYLIDSSIEANIAFGEKEIDVQKLNTAIQAAQLCKLVEALPQGVKTRVGERGGCLSGGERQRIAIARALYRNPEVLIFDEATSALDEKTESCLMETIYQVSKDRTVIMIAHRLTTLKACHQIIVMDEGRIKEIIACPQRESSLE